MKVHRPFFSKTVVLALFFAGLVQPAGAQDVLPEQGGHAVVMDAPIMPSLMTLGTMVDLENPASYLYPDWSNSHAHNYGNVKLPDSVVISMDGYRMPTDSTRITDTYGYRPRRGRWHMGLDVKVKTGDTIRAAFDGKVRVSDYERKGYGHYLVIRHPNGLETTYGHLSRKLVEENEIVHAGDPIGLGGSTGRSTGSHLHFETRILGTAIDPALLFDFPNQTAVTDCYVYQAKIAPQYYKVKSGDTLGRIAARNQTSVSKICSLNGISSKTVLRVGQSLRIK